MLLCHRHFLTCYLIFFPVTQDIEDTIFNDFGISTTRVCRGVVMYILNTFDDTELDDVWLIISYS